MDILDLKKELDSGNKRELYVFVGNENFMIKTYIRKITTNPINVNSFKELIPKLQNLNLFSSSATYIITNDKEILDKEKDKIIKHLKGSTLILVYPEADKRKALFKEEFFEFNKLDVSTVALFIKREIDISNDLAETIAYRCGNVMSRVESEIDKLKSLGEPITKELIDDLIKKLPDDVVFDMVGAVVKKNKKQALMYLQDILELKENPIPLLYRNFRNVLLVQGYQGLNPNEIAEKTGINEKAVYAIKRLINHYTLEELIDNLKMIFETDLNIKTGKEERVEAATTNLIIKLCRA